MLDALLAGGVSGLLSGATGLLGGLVDSGGTSSAQQLDMLKKYYQPTKAGWSWAQLENQYAIEQYRKQLASSANADLNLSKQMNMELPSAQVVGLRAANLNPILAVLGSGFSPIQSSASASMTGGARVPSGLSKPHRSVNSGQSLNSLYKVFSGVVDAEKENKEADTDVKAATVGNIKSQNDLIRAQAHKTDVEADRIQDQIDHGDSSYSDFGREVRFGVGKPLERMVDSALRFFGYGSPEAVKPDSVSQRTGNSAKQPGITIEVNTKPKSEAVPNRNNRNYNFEQRWSPRPLPSIYD